MKAAPMRDFHSTPGEMLGPPAGIMAEILLRETLLLY
jgi:hypothetical protein